MMNSKTPFTEEELDEIIDLNMNMGIYLGMSKIEKVLEKLILTNSKNILNEVSNFRIKEWDELCSQHKNIYHNSTLKDKLNLRISQNE